MDTPQIILKAIQKVNDKLTADCPHFAELRDTIYVIVDTEKGKLQTKLLDLNNLSNGFAHVESNYNLGEEGKKSLVNLIVLYHHNCVSAGLTEDEITGVILHELGHLMNDPTDELVPSFLESIKTGKPYQHGDAARVKYQNTLSRECYADHYARIYGFGNEVSSALIKYYQMTSIPPTEMALERIAILAAPTTEGMKGRVKVLKTE